MHMLPMVVLSICIQEEDYYPGALLALKQQQFKLDLEAYITDLEKLLLQSKSTEGSKIM